MNTHISEPWLILFDGNYCSLFSKLHPRQKKEIQSQKLAYRIADSIPFSISQFFIQKMHYSILDLKLQPDVQWA